MAIVSRSIVEAIDFSSLAGTAASNSAFPSAASAENRLNAIFGVGWGDRGYGQQSPVIPAVRPGTVIAGSQWQSLLSVLASCANHQGTSLSNLPSSSFYNSGNTITANTFDWPTAIASVDAARLTASNLASSLGASNTRTTSWTAKPEFSVEVDFGTEDAARWFFNSGGNISIASNFVPATGNAQNLSWQQLLNTDSGTISIGSYSSTRSGGNPSQGLLYGDTGYYTLGDSLAEVFAISPTSAPFDVNVYSIYVQSLGRTGTNGGNGSRLKISVFFDDQYGTPSQPVTGSLTASISITKAVGELSIADPVITVVQDLSGGGGTPVFEFVDTINSYITNYDLLARATAAGYPGNMSLYATVIVEAGAVVGSTSLAVGAITVPPLFSGSRVRIINNGFIVGLGGNGGIGSSWWPLPGQNGNSGGLALHLQWQTLLQNYNIIGGGGGGGGGSSTGANSQTYDDPGGSGGGGAGYIFGSPGSVGPAPSYWGEPGTLTVGGAGGVPSPSSGSAEWFFGRNGGPGGSLGQPGQNGSGDYGFGFGGTAGVAIQGSANIESGSLLGTILGTQIP